MYHRAFKAGSCCRKSLWQRCVTVRASCSATVPLSPGLMQPLAGHIDGFTRRIAQVNNGLPQLTAGSLIPFSVDGQQLGYLKQEFVQRLLEHPTVFQLQAAASSQQQVLTLAPQYATMQQRTAAVAPVMEALRQQGFIKGWRNELYPVTAAFDAQPALLIERAAAPYFGIRAYGVHINGYTVAADGSKKLWVARRSASKQTWPGLLDHIVAGGQPFGLTCKENVLKECWEEAGIPAELAAAAQPVGFVSYVSMTEEGLKPDVLFCFDLQLPEEFAPVPQDGEVQEFMLWDMDRVASVISSSDEYKPNCCLVVIDFFIRHGLLSPDEPGYINMIHQLRAGNPL